MLITQYGAGLKNTDGSAYCGGRSANTKDDITGFIDTDETNWIDVNLLGPLNTTVERAATAANANGQGPNWKLISSHVPVFRNHGPCSAEPWTNINNTALTEEGNNLPDKPDDSSREGLARLNTALATAKGGAIGCGIGAMAIFFSVAGCAAGAGGGLIVGLATNEAESAVSAGTGHPNWRGWQAIGEAIFPELDAAFKRTFTPLPPNRTRQFGARVNGDIILRWDDRSSVETRYEVEIFSRANPTTPVVRETNLPTNSVEYTYKAGQAFVGFARARACNSVFCSPFSAKVKITNMKAGVPTGLSALTYENRMPAADHPDTFVVQATDPRNADTATRIELTQLTDANSAVLPVRKSNTKVFNVPSPFPSIFTFGGATGIPKGLYRVRAASCNLLGCSEFSTTTDSRAAPGPPNLKIAELPPFVVDGLGLARPRVRADLPPEPGSGGPSTTLPSPGPSTTLR